MAAVIEMGQLPDGQQKERNATTIKSHQRPLLDPQHTPNEEQKQVLKDGTAEQVRDLLSKIDPNLQFQNSRPIHLAADSGNVHAVTSLLEDSRTFVQHVNGYNRTALHLAARKGNHEVLKLLLEHNKGRDIDINAVDKQGRTALHLAAEMPVSGDDTEERFLRCLMLLMSRSDLEVSKPDYFGRTAISRALRKSHKSRVQVILKHRGEHKLNLDYCLVDGGQTVRESILEKFPELISFLPDPLMEDMNSSQPKIRLLAALQHDNLEEFTDILQKNKSLINDQYKEPYYCTCLELSCVIKGREKFAQVILDLNCDPNVGNYISKIPLLHITAERLNLPALEVLLSTKGININVKGLNEGTVLHWMALNKREGDEACMSLDKCVSLLMRSTKDQISINAKDSREDTPLHVAARWDNLNLALNLLASGASVDVWNKNHHTPLHVAALSGSKDAVLTLRKYGADINAEHGRGTPLYVAAQMGKKEIVLLLLKLGANFMFETSKEASLQYIDPEILKNYFDSCIVNNGKQYKDKKYMLTFKYNFLTPVKEKSGFPNANNEMHPLLKMNEIPELRELLKHPLISSVLYLKWHRVRKVFYFNIGLYSLFLLFLSLHVVFMHDTSEGSERHSFNKSTGIDNTTDETQTSLLRSRTIIVVLVMIFLSFLILREAVQFLFDWSEYLHNPGNLIDVSIIVSTFISCTVPHGQVIHHATSIAILLAWIEFLLMIGRLPSISVKLEMLKKVSMTFLKFGLYYFPLIIAFALSFSVLFYGQHNLDKGASITEDIMNKTSSSFLFIFTTFIMFTGEFEANDLPFHSTAGTSHLVFLLFVLLVALTLLNLLNGLAVSDTCAIIQNAETVSLVARAKLVLHTENMVLRYQKKGYLKNIAIRFCFFFRDLPSKRLFIYPNDDYKFRYSPSDGVIGKMDQSIMKSAMLITKSNTSES